MDAKFFLKETIKKISLVIIFFLNFNASSQQWEEVFLLSEKSIEEGRLDNAKHVLINNKSQFTGDSLASVYFQQVGYIDYLSANYSEAISALGKAVSICQRSNCNSEALFFNHYLIGKSYFHLNRFDFAEKHLKKALTIWESFREERHDLLIPLLDELSKVFFAKRDFNKLRGALEILLEVFKSDQVHIKEQRRFCNFQSFIELVDGNDTRAKEYLKLGISIANTKRDNIQGQMYLQLATLEFFNGNSYAGESALDKALMISSEKDFQFPFNDLLTLSSAYFFHYNNDDKTAISKLHNSKNSQLSIIERWSYELLIKLQIEYNLSSGARKSLSHLLNYRTKLEVTEIETDRYEANILKTEGRIEEAIKKFEGIVSLTEEDIDNYASLLIEVGSFHKAKDLYINKLDEIEGNKGTGNIEYLTLLNNLGILYLQLEEFPEAEYILRNSLRISKNAFGQGSAQFAFAANNLGTLYFEIGNYEESVKYLSIAKGLYANLFSKESEAYLTLQNNIAILYSAIGSHDTSIEILTTILELERELLGEKNLSYLTTLNNLIKERINNEEYQEAILEVKKAITALKSISVGQDELARAYFLEGLAYFETTKYQEAIRSLEESKVKYEEINDINTKEYAITLFKLAECYAILGDEPSAWSSFDRSISIFNKSIDRVFSFSSEKEKEKYLKTVQHYYDLYNYYISSHFKNKELIASKLFEQSIFRKGILFKSSVQIRNAALNSNDKGLIEKYYEWIAVQKNISQGIGFNDDERTKELEAKANQIEKELNQSIKKTEKVDHKFSSSSLKGILNSDQAVLDMIRYYNPEEEDHFYGCLLFVGSKDPEFVELCRERALISEIGETASNNKPYIDKLYGDGATHNDKLYDLIWKPLQEKLSESREVYVSPTGVLHKIAFDALGKNEETLLNDEWELRYLSDISSLAEQNVITSYDINQIALFGGVQYSTEDAKTEYWSYLPGTKEEVENIESILSSSYKVDKYMGLNASEVNFKKSARNYEVLHIATHGFFFPDQQTLASTIEGEKAVVEDMNFRGTRKKAGLSMFTENKNPLIRSGIALAKANDLSNPDRYFSKEDGVLTAFEVSQMNLSKSKLVVLSACETGVGEIRGNEGVYGLERAFKMQGVPCLIISLWQVPDQETKEFMSIFYKNLSNKDSSVIESFKSAKQTMREKYPPYYWAAFKLVE
jgi:CHAT domain-containing protein